MSKVKSIIVPVEASEFLGKIKDMKAGGYRLAQACATKAPAGFEILYSFDKDHELTSLKLSVPEEYKVPSITGEYWAAFIYENEMHDLFGIKFTNMALDYDGKFFKVSEPTPWNPKK